MWKAIWTKCLLPSLLEGGRGLLLYPFKAGRWAAWTVFPLFWGQGKVPVTCTKQVWRSRSYIREPSTSLSVLCKLPGVETTSSEFIGGVACRDLAVVMDWLVICREQRRSPCGCRCTAWRTFLFHATVCTDGHGCSLPSSRPPADVDLPRCKSARTHVQSRLLNGFLPYF